MITFTACGASDPQSGDSSTAEQPNTAQTQENGSTSSDQAAVTTDNASESSQAESSETTSETASETASETPLETSSEMYLFPESSQTLLTAEGIAGYDIVLLQAGVNEIYARHGYTFKTAAWQTYFDKKAWYTPNAAFSENDFSEIEKSNIAFLQSAEPTLCTDEIKIDFNQDGITDQINVEGSSLYARIDFGYGYEADAWSESYMGSMVTDMDINDGEMELLVYDAGPSADYSISICLPAENDLYTRLAQFSAQYYDHTIDGKQNATFEVFEDMVYCVGAFRYEEGTMIQTDTTYPVFTLARETAHFKKGDRVQLKVKTPEVLDEPKYMLVIGSPEDANIVDTVTTTDDYMDYMDTLTSYFDEIGMMYYGD
jgi:hypothetical protein